MDVLRAMADFHSKTPAEMNEAVKQVRNCTTFLTLFHEIGVIGGHVSVLLLPYHMNQACKGGNFADWPSTHISQISTSVKM